MRRGIAVFIVVFLTGLIGYAEDWPRFLGPNADNISPEKGINKDWKQKPPRQLWKVKLSDKGYAAPSVAGGMLFIIDHRGDQDVVRAIDVKTGQDAWRFPYSEPGKANYGFSRGTPAVDGGRVYTLSRSGKLHCLDQKNGRKIWMRDLAADSRAKPPRWMMATSPVIDGNRVIAATSGPDATIVILDKKTGRTLGKGGGGEVAGYSTPVIASINSTKQYVIFTGKAVLGISASRGKTIWRSAWQTKYDVNAATPVVFGNYVFITSNYGVGCALVKIKGTNAGIVWKNKDIQSLFSTPVLFEGHLYCTSDPGQLVCMEAKTGNVVWKQRGFQKGGLIGIDGSLIVVDGGNGDVALVEMTPKAYQELGRIRPLGGQSWTAPVVADMKLFVRNKDALVCLDLK